MTARLTIFDAIVRRDSRILSRPGRTEIAEKIAAQARADAPVLTGAYRNGIDVEQIGGEPHVVDYDEDSPYKEYGTSDTPPHAVLTNAARRYGRYTGWTPRR